MGSEYVGTEHVDSSLEKKLKEGLGLREGSLTGAMGAFPFASGKNRRWYRRERQAGRGVRRVGSGRALTR